MRAGGVKKYLAMALVLVFGLIGLTIFFNVAGSTIPDASEAYYNLANAYNATAIGTGAATLATSSPQWLGYIWVILPFAVGAVLLTKMIK